MVQLELDKGVIMPNNESERRHGEDVDVLSLLEEELKSCVMPSIKDPSAATTDELIKDVHRVLSGNGGPTRGLIYKVAAANVHTKLLRSATRDLREKVEQQEEQCLIHQRTMQDKEAQNAADRIDARKIKNVLWSNRYLLIMILAGSFIVVFNTFRGLLHYGNSTSDMHKVEAPYQQDNTIKAIHRLESVLEALMAAEGLSIEDVKPDTNPKQARPGNRSTIYTTNTPVSCLTLNGRAVTRL